MYGHVIAELRRRGVSTCQTRREHRARRGIEFLLRRRRRHASGLVLLAHPWETGCDDSPRWDDVSGVDGFDLSAWYARKGELVASVEFDDDGAPSAIVTLRSRPPGSTRSFAFNARELGMDADDVADALDARWDDAHVTWIDAGETEHGSGRARTVDGLLATLVSRDARKLDAAFDAMVDPHAHGAPIRPHGRPSRGAVFRAVWVLAWPDLAAALLPVVGGCPTRRPPRRRVDDRGSDGRGRRSIRLCGVLASGHRRGPRRHSSELDRPRALDGRLVNEHRGREPGQLDDRAAIHARSQFYDVEGWLRDRLGPRPNEVDALGDVAGLRLAHLQCHIGTDTLAFAARRRDRDRARLLGAVR